MRRHVVLRRQILHHCIGAAVAEFVVVLLGANRIRAAGNFQNVALRRAKLRGKAVKLFLVVLGQHSLVEAEVHSGIGDRMVVIETRYDRVKRIGAMHCIVGRGFRLAGRLLGAVCAFWLAVLAEFCAF